MSEFVDGGLDEDRTYDEWVDRVLDRLHKRALEVLPDACAKAGLRWEELSTGLRDELEDQVVQRAWKAKAAPRYVVDEVVQDLINEKAASEATETARTRA